MLNQNYCCNPWILSFSPGKSIHVSNRRVYEPIGMHANTYKVLIVSGKYGNEWLWYEPGPSIHPPSDKISNPPRITRRVPLRPAYLQRTQATHAHLFPTDPVSCLLQIPSLPSSLVPNLKILPIQCVFYMLSANHVHHSRPPPPSRPGHE